MPAPLNGKRVRLYFRGQNAIWHGMRILEFPPGANILFPAYQCGAELDPVIRAGVGVRFYRVDMNMRIDFDSVRRAVNGRTRAFYLIHYLGFPRDIEEASLFCAAFGLALVEDCAHALYGRFEGRPLGTFGSLGIFSMRKTLPVPDGGALVVNDARLPLPDLPRTPPMTHTLRAVRHRMDHLLVHHGGPLGQLAKRALIDPCAWVAKRISTRVAPESWVKADEDPIAFNAGRSDWSLSPLARILIGRTDHEQVVRRRRENFLFLLNRLRHCERLGLILTDLPDGVCPWFFPVVVTDPSSLIDHLDRGGIYARTLWEDFHPCFPRNEFPEATKLKSQVVALPIHQGLDGPALEALADHVTKWGECRIPRTAG